VLPKEYRRALIVSLLVELRQEEETPSRRKPLRPEALIGTDGFDGFFLQIAKEVNRAFDCGCYVATAALSRKLLEALLLSIMQKRYGSSHPEYYFRSGKPAPLERILSRFWRSFSSDFLQFSPTREEARLDAIRRNLKGLKDDMNVDVHEIGSLTDRQSLIDTKKQIQEVMDFLLYIDQRVGPESS